VSLLFLMQWLTLVVKSLLLIQVFGGVWLPKAEALLDIRIADTGTQIHTPKSVLFDAELEKKRNI